MAPTSRQPSYERRRCDHCGALRQMRPGRRFCDRLCKDRFYNAERKRLAEWAKKHHPDHRESA
jgi:hypothetical protein